MYQNAIYNHGQNIVGKWQITKVSKIDVSLECFEEDFL